jgi:hypothetical protein
LIIIALFYKKSDFLKKVKWIHIGFLIRLHSIMTYALSFTACLEIISGSSTALKVLAWFFILILVSFGLLIFFKLQKPQNTLTEKVSQNIKYGSFFKLYKFERRYFSVVQFYRKMLIGILLAVLLKGDIYQSLSLFFVEILIFISMFILKPFLSKMIFYLSMFSSLSKILVILTSFFFGSNAENRLTLSILMIVFEVAVLICNFLVLFVSIISNISKKKTMIALETSVPIKVTSTIDKEKDPQANTLV